MSKLAFDKNSTEDVAKLLQTPRSVITLGINLCSAVRASCEGGTFRGSIWPGNITVKNLKPTLGPARGMSISTMSPEELEYISPEQFWNGENTPQSDVYSIGLVLYTLLNNGFMPFFDSEREITAENRASAMQRRMNGHVPPYPATAGRELGDVVLKAIAFKAGERYADVAELQTALENLPEGAAVPAAVPVVPLTADEVKAAKSYKVDKDFEETTPLRPARAKAAKPESTVDEDTDPIEFRRSRPSRRLGWLGPVVAAAAVVAVLLFLLRGCEEEDDSLDNSNPTPPVGDIDTTPTPPVITPDNNNGGEEPDPSPSPTPTPTPPAEPTFEILIEDVTWEEARARCEELGGHLATIANSRQMNEVIALIEESGAKYVWLGSYRGEDGQWYDVTGGRMGFAAWDEGEPSVRDTDGTPEDYLMMWFSRDVDAWLYNDMRNDPISLYPGTFSGNVAFICQYD